MDFEFPSSFNMTNPAGPKSDFLEESGSNQLRKWMVDDPDLAQVTNWLAVKCFPAWLPRHRDSNAGDVGG